MDFIELEAIEGIRWPWQSWPTTKPEAASLTIPLSVMCTPLTEFSELPILPYDPLICSQCGAVLNPYARVDYTYRIWYCSFCFFKNSFPRTYSSSLEESNLPAELFPNYSSVEYARTVNSVPKTMGSSLSLSSLSSMNSPKSLAGEVGVRGPAFEFVIGG